MKLQRLVGMLSVMVVAVLVLSACGSEDDDEIGDVATRVTVQGAPTPLPTPDPNATPVEEESGGNAGGGTPGGGGDAGGGDTAGGGATIEMTMPGIAWSQTELTMKAGDTISFTNDGSGGAHDFVIEGYNGDEPLVDLPAGQTVTWTVPADLQPGTYTFYCAIPGHRPAGMEGTITIQ